MYYCGADGGDVPSGFADCYQFDNNPYAYCRHDACVRADNEDTACAMAMAPPKAWQCSATAGTTGLPTGCTAPGISGFWCCP